MIQTMIKNWWLLALCGVLEAMISVVYLIMQDPDGSLTLRTHALQSTVVLLGKLAVAAGACAIAAGIWRSTKNICWLLVLNGAALGALGLIFNGILGPRVSFRTIVELLVVVAMSMGILELATARNLRSVSDKWILGLAGAASIGFALVFLALGLDWIKPEPRTHSDILWVGSYFGFSAICMLGLALRGRRLGRGRSEKWGGLSALGNPGHVH
jgi:uncharacterized membrane protein HdeD (DUF308 family)